MRQAPLQSVLLSLTSGARPKGGVSAESGEIPTVGGEHLTADGGFDFANIKRIPRTFFEAMRGGHIAALDVLVVKDGATTGKTALVDTGFPFSEAAVNEHVFCVRVDPERASPRYVYHYLRSPEGQRAIHLDFRGATVGGISREFATKTVVPLPPLADQQRIAKILDQAEALRAKRRSALAELEGLSQSVFLDMFGTPAVAWPLPTVGELAATPGAVRTGPFGSQLLHSEFVSQGIAVLGIDNAVTNEFRWAKPRFITSSKYAQLRRYTVKPGDVLITIMGTCGRCAVVPDDMPTAINTKHLCCITLDRRRCLPEYLHAYFLQHPRAQRYLTKMAQGAIMAGLNMGIIKAMPISLPPVHLQRQFVQTIEQVSVLRRVHQNELLQLDALVGSLRHRAFRGEL